MAAKVQPMPDLKQRMASATAASAPSLVPEQLNPPPPKEEEVTPTLQELITDRKDFLALKRLVNEDIAGADGAAAGAAARDAGIIKKQ